MYSGGPQDDWASFRMPVDFLEHQKKKWRLIVKCEIGGCGNTTCLRLKNKQITEHYFPQDVIGKYLQTSFIIINIFIFCHSILFMNAVEELSDQSVIMCCCILYCSSGVSSNHRIGRSFLRLTSKPSLSRLGRICTALDAMGCFLNGFCRLSCMENLYSRTEQLVFFLAIEQESQKIRMMVDQV